MGSFWGPVRRRLPTVSPAPGLGGYRIHDWTVNPLGGMTVDVPPLDESV
jgi:hypothetical protein